MVEPLPQEPGETEELEENWIGIDLGTTYTAAGIWYNGNVRMLQNWEDGKMTTPSVVSYTNKGDTLVGNPAVNKAIRNLHNTVFDAKRLLGMRFSDEKIAEHQKTWPFEVVEGENDRPMIKLHKINNKDVTVFPEEVQAKVLSSIKRSADNTANKDIRKCVITVPAYFKDNQK